ncbi:MAG: hypothetical protein AB1716_07660 [Planctomycetota bacterium]
MDAEEIRKHLKKQPFVPFRVHLSDDSAYDVPHPDFAWVTRRLVTIGLRPAQNGIPEQSVFCDPLHITHIEPLSEAERTRRTG